MNGLRANAGTKGVGRVAVIGAPTEMGARLREALIEYGVPGSDVGLFATTSGEAILSEYDGEARLVQEPDLSEIAGYDVVFLCENGEIPRRLAASATGPWVIDVVDCLPDRVPRVHVDINPQRADARESRCFAVAHPLAVLLAEILHPLERDLGLAEAMAVILRPASDFGDRGVEELREQTVQLLSLKTVSVKTFGRPLAFNVIPEGGGTHPEPGLETRIVREVGELVGWSEERLTVKLVTVPLFHGHSVQLRFRLGRPESLERVRSVLGRAGFPTDGPAPVTTPLEATGEVRTILSDLSADGLGAFWVWAVAGETVSRTALQAVRLAVQLRAS